MVCPKCGNNIDDASETCPICGNVINDKSKENQPEQIQNDNLNNQENNNTSNDSSNNQKDKKKLFIMMVIFLLLLLLISFSIMYFSKNKDNGDSNTDDENINEEQEDEETVDDSKDDSDDQTDLSDEKNFYSIELAKNKEELKVDEHLSLEFIGEATTDVEDGYKYTLKITLDGKPLDSATLFEDSTDKVIYSANYAASFSVTKLNDTYVLNSGIASQNNGHYVSIINNKGSVMKNFYDVSMNISSQENQIEISKCLDFSVDGVCPTTTYEVKDGEVIYLKTTDSITSAQAISILKKIDKNKLGIKSDINKYNVKVVKEDAFKNYDADQEVKNDEGFYDIQVSLNSESYEYLVTKDGVSIYKVLGYEYVQIV